MSMSKLKDILIKYTLDDLAKTFFTLSIWLPNVSSPIKLFYLYENLELICDKLPDENKIQKYSDFVKLSNEIFKALPDFPIFEDCIYKNDWGEIKYFLNEKMYKVLYGGILSYTTDYYKSYEIIYSGHDSDFLEKIGRSPIKELEFCLSIQNIIISSFDREVQDFDGSVQGKLRVPSEEFWNESLSFLESFNVVNICPDVDIAEYTFNISSEIKTKDTFEINTFIRKIFSDEGFNYFFIRNKERCYPVMPRNYCNVIYNKWGSILKKFISSIEEEDSSCKLRLDSGVQQYLKQRINKDEFIQSCSALVNTETPHDLVFTSAFISEHRLILLYVLPPVKEENYEKEIHVISNKISEVKSLFANKPLILLDRVTGKLIQIKSKNEETVDEISPFVIAILPTTDTDSYRLPLPENHKIDHLYSLYEFLLIFDEIKNLQEVSDYFYYLEEYKKQIKMPATSSVDTYASFRDSNSILIEGAESPDMIMLDPHWGNDFRYDSLTQFWKLYPSSFLMGGDPRSWSVRSKNKDTTTLISRYSKNYIRHALINNTDFYISSPVELLSCKQNKIADLLMDSICDSLSLYSKKILPLTSTKTGCEISILIFPDGSVREEQSLKHLKSLIPNKDRWLIDCKLIDKNHIGIRLVYEEGYIVKRLDNAVDRSFQLELFIDILLQLGSYRDKKILDKIIQELNNDKFKPKRFYLYHKEKEVSFPNFEYVVEPSLKETKYINKRIANYARKHKIPLGSFKNGKAKEKIDLIKNYLEIDLNKIINLYDFKKSLPLLIRNIDSITEKNDRLDTSVKMSLESEVNYERDSRLTKNKTNFIFQHKCNRYLIEKFVQLQPNGSKILTEKFLKLMIAQAQKITEYSAISDFLHYGLYEANLEISNNYIFKIITNEKYNKMYQDWSKEKSQIELGMIGNRSDDISIGLDLNLFIDELDEGFIKDQGFSFRDMLQVMDILKAWTAFTDKQENTHYSVKKNKVIKVCLETINEIDTTTAQKILDFLTLDHSKLLSIQGNPEPSNYLPIWEHRKRFYRYLLKPIILIEDSLIWGPHSVSSSAKTWLSNIVSCKLPAELEALNIDKVVNRWHEKEEKSLQHKIEEIALRHSKYVEKEVYPHKFRLSDNDIGDIDVLCYLEDSNLLISIESKFIDTAYCYKDSKRVYEKIYGRIDSQGKYKKGYLSHHENRHLNISGASEKYLEKIFNLKTLVNTPTIKSIFVTQIAHWWTKFPQTKTDVEFIQLELLSDYISSLKGDN